MVYPTETKEDRAREIDPKLMFPLKEWLYGFLPDHSFSWGLDEDEAKLKDYAQRVMYKKSHNPPPLSRLLLLRR